MGNEESYETSQPHPRFSKVQYSSSKISMIVREPITSKTKQVNTWLERQRLYRHIYSSPSIFACRSHRVEASGACSEAGTFIGEYEGIYARTLKQEIGLQGAQSKYFTQQQIWYFILFIAKQAHEIYQFGDNHLIGNIHPSNVLVDQKGNYRLIIANYSFSLPNLLDHFREYQVNGDSQAFISPQLIGFLYSTKYPEYPNYPKCVNKQAAEAFSFGLTILSMATLEQRMSKIYKKYINRKAQSKAFQSASLRSTTSIDTSKRFTSTMAECDHLQVLLGQVKQRYSPVLYQLIVSLTCPDPLKRSHANEVYSVILKPIQRSILMFDGKWLQVVKEASQQQLPQPPSMKQICNNWARNESYILKEEKESHIQQK